MLLLALALAAQELQEDFEGRRPSATEIYPGWETVRDSEHPTWNEPELAASGSPHGGKRYIRLPTRGGGTAFQLRIKSAVPVTSDRTYLFTGFVRIPPPEREERPRNNRAFLEIRWLDLRCELLRADRSVGIAAAYDWTPVALEVAVPPAGATWAQLRLGYEGSDVRGECHFDTLVFRGQPRLQVEPAGRKLPVFRPGEAALFRIAVPASVTGDPTLLISLRDAAGRDTGPTRSLNLGERRALSETFDLPGPGYFELHTRLVSDGTVVARKITPVLAPPPPFHPRAPGRTFGVVLNPYLDRLRDPGALADLLGCQRIKMVVWDHFSGRRSTEPDSAEIVGLLRALAEAEASTFTAVLVRPPRSLFPGVDPANLRDDPLALFSLPKSAWETGFYSTVERYADYLSDWQVGGDANGGIAYGTQSEVALGEVLKVIRVRSRSGRVGVPVSIADAEGVGVPSARFFAVQPRAASPAARYADPLPTPDGRESHLVVEVPVLGPDDRDGARRDQAAELLRRLIHAAAGGAPVVYVPMTGDPQTGLLDADGFPAAGALAVRTVNDVLSGAVLVKGRHLLPPPIRDLVFLKGGTMTLALWSESGTVPVDAFFGYQARIVDPLGATRAIEPGAKFEVGSVPLFVVGIDPLLLETQVSVQFHAREKGEPRDATIPLRLDPPVKLLRLKNHFPDDLRNVSYRIADPLPAGWTVAPRENKISLLKAGEIFQTEVTVTIPPSEQEGTREIAIDLTFVKKEAGDLKTYTLRVRRALTLTAELAVVPVVERIDDDLRRMRLFVRNRSDHTVNLGGWVRIPGQPDRKVSLGGLKKDTDEEIHLLEYSASRLRGRSVEVLLEEKGGKRILLNKRIPLD